MAERIRFHLDENVDPDIARALRRYGIDVTTIIEAGMRGLSDEAQLAFIRQEKRVLVTHDADFLRLAYESGRKMRLTDVHGELTRRSRTEDIPHFSRVFSQFGQSALNDKFSACRTLRGTTGNLLRALRCRSS